jgi:hypothetical protein
MAQHLHSTAFAPVAGKRRCCSITICPQEQGALNAPLLTLRAPTHQKEKPASLQSLREISVEWMRIELTTS